MLTRSICLTLAAFVAASGALAQAPRTPPATPDERTAAGVDRETFLTRHRTRLLRADADGDGRIARSEWAAWWAARPGKGPADPEGRFRAIDADVDGFLTAREIDATFAKRFDRLDADHDGRVTAAERPCRTK